MVRNVHEREIRASIEACGELLNDLGTPRDHFWPSHRWPPMRFKGPLEVGVKGGHGPIRYFVKALDPGRSVRFQFTGPQGFIGWHGLEVETRGTDSVVLRHTLEMRTQGSARITWPFVFRWLHDALVEDALDCAQDHLEGRPPRTPRPLWFWVRFLRKLKGAPNLRPKPICDFSLAQFEAELFDPSLR